MSTTWIRVAYGAVLALVLFFTIQFGVAMALPGPTPPGDPGITFRQLTSDETDNSQNRLTASVDQYYADAKNFRDDYVSYQRNTFLAGAGLAVLLALIGVALPAAVNYMRWGLLLGAGLTLIWAGYVASTPVPNPAPAANSILALVSAGEPEPLAFAGRFLRFAISFVSLILLLFIGLWRLTEWPTTTRKAAAVTTTTTRTSTPPSAPGTDASTWAPAPGSTTPAGESTTVVSEGTPPRTDGPPPEAGGRWQRPETGEPSRQPDTTV